MKKPVVWQCFPYSQVVFTRNADDMPKGEGTVFGVIPNLGDMAVGVKILRLKDGFMLSVGLVADLIKPLL
ncbi:MAG: hypothetical protein Q7U16_05155 [Agitococcus sp.]|nr:hypothetical protein [Agitococcus sp.]